MKCFGKLAIVWVGVMATLFGACGCQQETPQPVRPPSSASLPAKPLEPKPFVRERAVQSSESEEVTGSPPPGQVPDVEMVPKTVMREAIELQRVELLAEALPIWRRYADRKPVLLLLSNSPMTLPIPEPLRAESDALAQSGSSAELFRRGNPGRPDPLFLPDMILDAPLRLGWFKQLAWAVPVADPENPPTGSMLREQMQGAGLINREESASLVGGKMPLRMQLRGVPMTLTPLADLPAIEGPALLHIDLGYFQGLYKSEIATPVLGLVARTLALLREKHIQVMAVTFSYGNLDGRISLDVRFQGELLTELLANPQLFDAPLATRWEQQKDILYLKNFFKKDMVMERARAQDRELPGKAWIKFNLFRAAADLNQGTEALRYLADAVKYDKVYAMQYLDLASLAFERGRPDEALRMLKLASDAFPENPHIRLQMAQLAGQLGDSKTASHLVRQLQTLPWSSIYYPQMPDYLQGFMEHLESNPPLSPSAMPPATTPPAEIKKGTSLPHAATGTLPPGHP